MYTTMRLAVAINLFSLMLLFADDVMLPLRTVSFSFPAIHVHMPTALVKKKRQIPLRTNGTDGIVNQN